ncbi:unnamed protein product, partial [Rangifer tarandus platyrhynchus]
MAASDDGTWTCSEFRFMGERWSKRGCSQQGNAPPALPQVDFATSGGPETSLVSEQLPLLSRETVASSVMH